MTGKTDSTRTKVCVTCGCEFAYAIGKGKDRKHCSVECRKKYQASRRPDKSEWNKCACGKTARRLKGTLCNTCYGLRQKESAGLCLVRGCRKPAIRKGRTLCEMHYIRLRRNGSYNPKREPMGEYVDGYGYVHVREPCHPLSKKSGYVAKHRKVLWDSESGLSQCCYWCGASVDWSDLHVDHLNGDKLNNERGNLVASCPTCNKARGAAVHLLRRMRPEAEALFWKYVHQGGKA